MIRPRETPRTDVPAEEVARRIAEMRRIGYEHHAYAQVVYHRPSWECPWEGCGCCIKGIRFEFEKLGGPEQVEQWMKAFWLGPGVPARCPRCKRYVLFDVEGKEAVTDVSTMPSLPLPDNWYEVAYLGSNFRC
jgi:hypothetical protein